jgi:hypothetical protein
VHLDKINLYEVTSDYFLEAEFQNDCQLSRIDVRPKYFWAHLNADWKEPEQFVSLSNAQYEDLLKRIEQIKALGPLIHRGEAGEVTNATLWLVDHYERAYVERALHDSIVDETTRNRLTSFSIYFVRSIQGKISDKRVSGLLTKEKRNRLKINDRWYWVDDAEFKKAAIGKQGVFRVAGPIG